MRYDAFISYSHAADNAVAPALQAALHAFARPWSRMRALHVFRDQTSLAASPELWPAIEAALADARWMIVMASPEAAASRWVAREIEWWLTHRSMSTLLIVMTGGTLVWDDIAGDFDWQRTTSLPRQVLSGRLTGEPLWIDLSWAKSADVLSLRHARFRRAVLDLAAPLHGRPKDELDGEDVRRYAQMQRLRAGAIAGLSGLALLACAAAWVAASQRDEALRQATIAQAGRMAVHADLLRERGGPLDASVMLAAEALRMLDAIGERSADVDQRLRRALAGLPETRGTLDVSAQSVRLTPDGKLLMTTHLADQASALAVPGGEPRGCSRGAVEPLRQPAAGERLWLIQAVGDDGRWCVVHAFHGGSETHALELWSAAPLQQVARVTVPTQAGHVRPAVAPGGRWLAATDVPQNAETEAAVVHLWRVGLDGQVGPTQVLPGMKLLAFSPDGAHVATTAGLWRLSVEEVPAAPSNASSTVQRRITWDAEPWRVAFSSDNTHVASQDGPDTRVVVWDLATGKERLRTLPPPGELLALSAGGERLVVSSREGTTVWDAQLDVARARLPTAANAAALPGNGQALFIVRAVSDTGIQSQRLLSLPEQPAALSATVYPGKADSVRAMSLAPDGKVNVVEFATGDANGTGTVRLRRLASEVGRWGVAATLEGVTAFALASDGTRVAASAGGRVLIVPADGSEAPKPLSPPVAANALAFGNSASQLVAYAAAPGGGTLHVWALDGDKHASTPLEGTPSAMALSRDGSTVLAVVPYGDTTRGGTPHRLLRWRVGSPAAPEVIELGRRLSSPNSVCDVLVGPIAVGASAHGTGVPSADLLACADTAPATGWRIVTEDLQASVLAPSGVSVARIDHAAKLLGAAISADGKEVVTLDVSGQVQRFAVTPESLIAQACARRPQPLRAELRASLPAPAQVIDACGRAVDTATSLTETR